jgi:hypothetical protein
MYIPHEQRPAELKALTDLFSKRAGASFLKSRALKALSRELEDAHHIGLTWEEIWEALRECGYAGSYRQFAAMTRKLASPFQEVRTRTKNLPPPLVEKEKPHPGALRGAATVGNKEKPEWQIRREETMARLDRGGTCHRDNLCGPLLGPSRSYYLARLGAPLLRSQLCPAGLTSVRLDHL